MEAYLLLIISQESHRLIPLSTKLLKLPLFTPTMTLFFVLVLHLSYCMTRKGNLGKPFSITLKTCWVSTICEPPFTSQKQMASLNGWIRRYWQCKSKPPSWYAQTISRKLERRDGRCICNSISKSHMREGTWQREKTSSRKCLDKLTPIGSPWKLRSYWKPENGVASWYEKLMKSIW